METRQNNKYFFLHADTFDKDLTQLFDGHYNKKKKEWRFDLDKKEKVLSFFNDSSSENENENEYKSESLISVRFDPKEIEYKKNSSESELSDVSNDEVKSDGDSENNISIESLNLTPAVRKALISKQHHRDRLHRSNSFNASDSSDEEHESIDRHYRRHRSNIKKINTETKKLKSQLRKIN